ncbi:hypothetical protein ACFJGV_08645 [Cnuibacter sp. UC19_7]|uniref:hypothetical protein n=1 Tax=Cnuibacter sp. UC19_7 TaxID=3350166 RepID=UPI00366D3C41
MGSASAGDATTVAPPSTVANPASAVPGSPLVASCVPSGLSWMIHPFEVATSTSSRSTGTATSTGSPTPMPAKSND